MARLRSAHVVDTMFVPAPRQYTALEMVTASGWKRALATLGSALAHRRDVAVDAVSATFGPHALAVRPRDGYHLWVSVPDHLDSEQLATAVSSITEDPARRARTPPALRTPPADASTKPTDAGAQHCDPEPLTRDRLAGRA